MQRPLNFAIVDEVDSILIDEARTPLIISGRGDKPTEMYGRANQFVQRLREGEENDYVREEKEKTIVLTEEGVRKAEAFFGVTNPVSYTHLDVYKRQPDDLAADRGADRHGGASGDGAFHGRQDLLSVVLYLSLIHI